MAANVTGQQISDLAMTITRQTDANRRTPDSQLLVYVNAALERAAELRQDLLLDSDGSAMLTFAPLSALSDPTQFKQNKLTVLADFVCFRIYGEDSSDKSNRELSAMHKRLFEEGMMTNV